MTGELPNPGFFSDSGIFGTVYFKSKSPGLVKIACLPTSMVLINDGRGTNVLKDFAAVSYLILPDKIPENEQKKQKSISFNSNILGESSGSTQMNFYEEKNVLGAATKNYIEKGARPNLLEVPLNSFGEIDRFILEKWQKALNVFS